MGSRREEERNEKIIRGLMKLPPNRRCINCNSLGPQYVCTNFWTFVCMTCSGIHREFTHRVKSVSMAKFSSQEVEALQNGGNQRAREIYLKDWDLQLQRLPDSSFVDKIRQFIKDVYVDKRYAGGKTSEKPPRDTQNRGIHEDETRRASSYHSFSQSPPYDYQYEDRRYGKQGGSLTRKPGSDRGRYEGNLSSFMYSPGRASEQMYDDRFSNEVSVSRVSDYSASSGGDPFQSGTQSPNFQKDRGFGSPPFQASSENTRRQVTDTFPQRSRSAGSFGSIDSNFMTQTSFNSQGFTDAVPEAKHVSGAQDKLPFPGSSASGTTDSLNFFEAPHAAENISSAAPIDLFQLPEAPAPLPVDFFQASLASSAPSTNVFQPPQPSKTSIDLFAVTGQPQSTAVSNEKFPEFSESRNEGWATFDMPQSLAPTSSSHEIISPTIVPSDSRGSSGNLDLFSPLDSGMLWPTSQDSSFQSSNISTSWSDSLQSVTAPNATNPPLWNAFEDSLGHQPFEDIKQDSGILGGTDRVSSNPIQHLGFETSEGTGLESFDWTVSHDVVPCPVSSSLVVGPSYTQPVLPSVEETKQRSSDRKSNNPFDLPYDSEPLEDDMFMDMTSLQAGLPNVELSTSFLGDVSQPWFPQNSVSPYIPGTGQGGVAYLTPQAPTSQIPNASAQGPVASIGGNPFA